jgi:RNA polymerase sigma-70 factor (ECF subfamily)
MPASDPRATKPSLLLRIRDAGDSTSWGEFADLYGPIIRGYCRRRGLQEADAADVGQEVLAQVARAIGAFEYQPVRGRFRDWLGTETRNKIARFFEVRGRERPAAGDDPAARLEAVAEDPEWSAEFHARILEAALARIRHDFEDATWAAFERIWAGDQRAPEVARDLGLTIDAVYAAKSRVLRRLREEVLALADDLPCALPRA